MLSVSKNKIITMNRGDTFSVPFIISLCNSFDGEEYILSDNDILYFRVMQPNTSWENAEIKKEYTKEDCGAFGRVFISFTESDTKNMTPGKYYYEVKFRHIRNSSDAVDTLVSKREFIILD